MMTWKYLIQIGFNYILKVIHFYFLISYSTLDFKKRFISLLSYSFKELPASLALSIIDPPKKIMEENNNNKSFFFFVNNIEYMLVIPENEWKNFDLSSYDMKRLESYSNNLVDFHVIMDLLPYLAQRYYQEKIPISLSAGQHVILVGMGLQHKSLENITVNK